MRYLKIERVGSPSSIWNHKYDFQTKIARLEVQLPLNLIHICFEIAQFNSLNTTTTRFWSVPLFVVPVVAGL